ncbi:hypothetical protein AVEN_132993-1 [Araneus ventricosus]|uniref:Uncharacterized protein n=1 Tax=Araneus ventricosus TaxID=182803 RepID=A0A4Y2JPW6_ARAVE|nr:hypothetical protein AVEN_132993-1 [Araneus ventricosus]
MRQYHSHESEESDLKGYPTWVRSLENWPRSVVSSTIDYLHMNRIYLLECFLKLRACFLEATSYVSTVLDTLGLESSSDVSADSILGFSINCQAP